MVLTGTWGGGGGGGGVQRHSFLLEETCNVVLSCRRIWDKAGTIPITRILVRRRTHSSRSACAVWMLAARESAGGSHICRGWFWESLGYLNPPRHQSTLRPADMLSSLLLSAWVCLLREPNPPNSLRETWDLAVAPLHLPESLDHLLKQFECEYPPPPVRASFLLGESPCHVVRPWQITCPSTVLSTSALVVDLADLKTTTFNRKMYLGHSRLS